MNIPNVNDPEVQDYLLSKEDPMDIAKRILDRSKELIMLGAGSRDQSYRKKIANLPSIEEIFQEVIEVQKKDILK